MADEIKLERFKRALSESDFDVVVAVTPENSWYLSEAVIDTQRSLLERLALVVWAKGAEEPLYIVCTNEQVQARHDSWIKDIRGYVEYAQSPMQFLADALAELGATTARVGIEKHFLQTHYYEELKALVPKTRLDEVGEFFDRVRAIKTPDEVRRMEEAGVATDRAIRKAFEAARPGMTERQVGVMLTSELILNGAESQGFQVLAAGANTMMTHHRAGDYVLQSGDFMRTDFGGVFPGGYQSDLGRAVVIGKPSQRQLDTYSFIYGELEQMISELRPGVTPRELFLAHKSRWEAHGWPMPRPHIGHSIGIGIHEHPLIRPGDDSPLQPGMIICVEPAHTIPGIERYHMEDTVLVTEGEPRILSRFHNWSELLTPGA